MTAGSTAGATAAAAAAAAIAQAIKASGAIVRVRPHDFMKLLSRQDEPVVVTARGGVFTPHYKYLMGYKGLVFFTQSPAPLTLPANVEVIVAEKIWIPE
jgi:hypothetical protein